MTEGEKYILVITVIIGRHVKFDIFPPRDFEIVKIQHALDDIQSVKNQVHQILKEIMNEMQETVQVSFIVSPDIGFQSF